jgi:hypothetical protein
MKVIPLKNSCIESIRGTCGQCENWRRIEKEFGECCALPSVPATDYDEDGSPVLIFIRPSMTADEWSCIHFRGAN